MITRLINYVIKKLKQKILPPPLALFYKSEHGFKLERQHETDSCFDICASEDLSILPGSCEAVSTGIYLQLPDNCEAQIRSRSGLAFKKQIFVLNGIGTIDPGYTGEIKVVLFNLGKEPFNIQKGDRIAQVHFALINKINILEVPAITADTDRKNKGFGSTGVK